jgi:hypothetical protein
MSADLWQQINCEKVLYNGEVNEINKLLITTAM